MVDELEKPVSEQKEQSEQLMQAVFRKAFEGGISRSLREESLAENANGKREYDKKSLRTWRSCQKNLAILPEK